MSTTDPPRILSVEDNPDTRLLLRHTLKESYEVTLVPDVDEALQAVDADGYDLLLLDINLGTKCGGVELLHTIRDREATANIPAIAVTAFAMPGDREDLLDEGFDAYVGKPFGREELFETVEQTLSSTSAP